MCALAEHAGTSRQPIYQHFANLETHLGKHPYLLGGKLSLLEAVHAAEAVSLDLPPGRGDTLWQLIAGTTATPDRVEWVRRSLCAVARSVALKFTRATAS